MTGGSLLQDVEARAVHSVWDAAKVAEKSLGYVQGLEAGAAHRLWGHATGREKHKAGVKQPSLALLQGTSTNLFWGQSTEGSSDRGQLIIAGGGNAEEHQRLDVGAHVLIQGLHHAASSWNGKEGVILAFDGLSGRYTVQVVGSSEPPKRITSDHLQLLDSQTMGDPLGFMSEPEAAHMRPGTRVRLTGLIHKRALNGRIGIIRQFDFGTGRYVVEVPNEEPKRVKPQNLQALDSEDSVATRPSSAAKSVCADQVDPGPSDLPSGTHVKIHGLVSAAAVKGRWNGMLVTVHCFDSATQRYVVAMPDGSPKKLTPDHLSTTGTASEVIGQQAGATSSRTASNSGAVSICQTVSDSDHGPNGFEPGEKVMLQGLTSEAAVRGGWNGQTGVVHCFDEASQRYVVELPDGKPVRITGAHLQAVLDEEAAQTLPHSPVDNDGDGGATSICQTVPQGDGPSGLPQGVKVTLQGLTSEAAVRGGWNGQIAVVHCFDEASQRYVVALPDGKPVRVTAAHLIPGASEDPPTPQQEDSSLPPAAHTIPGAENSTSICQHQGALAHGGPKGLSAGDSVVIQRLQSEAAAKAGWNGKVGTVHCFDSSSQRYVIALPGNGPLRIKADHLTLVSAGKAADRQPDADGHPLVAGMHARVVGLKHATALNGQITTILGFDNKTHRYVVQMPEGSQKSIQSAHLAPVLTGSGTDGPKMKLSVCNAYAGSAPLQAFVVPQKGKKYKQVVQDLPYQACADVEDTLPGFAIDSIAFAVDRYEVARQPLNMSMLTGVHNEQLVVYRTKANSPKASIWKSLVERNGRFFVLHVINGYAGSRSLQLQVRVGQNVHRVPLDGSYRVAREQQISAVLSDGSQHLEVNFQPHLARTYCLVATGADEGPPPIGLSRHAGLVAHEVGSWTTAEEMPADPVDSETFETPPPREVEEAAEAAATMSPQAERTDDDSEPSDSDASRSSLGQMRASSTTSDGAWQWFLGILDPVDFGVLWR